MSKLYETLIPRSPPPLMERKKDYRFFSERHVQAMWLEQKYFKDLETEEGFAIEVLSPGIWNSEAGPDFLKAHVRIAGQDYFGDVEIHLAEGGWTQHGHHRDPRYNNVVLHVSLWNSLKPKELKMENGASFFQACLEDKLTIPINRIVQLIDLDLYPYQKFSGAGACSRKLFRGMSQGEIHELFTSASSWRLEKKWDFLNAHSPNSPVLAGMVMALGYKNNAKGFLKVFKSLEAFKAEEVLIYSISLGICGFFAETYAKRWKDSELFCRLREKYLEYQIESKYCVGLVLGNIRPLNHPVRRLVYLSKLLADPNSKKIQGTLELTWETQWKEVFHRKGCVSLKKTLFALIPTYTDSYWNQHFSFEPEPAKEHLSLLGDSLKLEILLNSFLPCLAMGVAKRKNPEEQRALDCFYESLPANLTNKKQYLHHRFFGDSKHTKQLAKASFAQGAYQLHKDFCLHYEASCEGCPFVEKYSDQR
jgi:hypothetical protein